MGKMKEIKFPATIAELVRNSGYKGNRKKFCDIVGISTSSLSHYERGKAYPTFQGLVNLSEEFDVSLDFLVFGKEQVGPATSDYSPLYRYIDKALADYAAKTEFETNMMYRIGSILGEGIGKAAKGLVNEDSLSPLGIISDEETMILERHSQETWILSMNLQYDILSVDDHPAAGRFAKIVEDNIKNGRPYRFLVPKPWREDWWNLVKSYSELLQNGCGDAFHANCKFRWTDAPVVSATGFYKLNIEQLRSKEPLLFEKIHRNVDDDCWLGYVLPPSQDLQVDFLMDRYHLKNAQLSFDRLWATGKPLHAPIKRSATISKTRAKKNE